MAAVPKSSKPSPPGVSRDDILKASKAAGIEKDIAARVIDLAENAVKNWTLITSPFMTPLETTELSKLLGSRIQDLTVIRWGGYLGAEREILGFVHSDTVNLPTKEQYGGVSVDADHDSFEPSSLSQMSEQQEKEFALATTKALSEIFQDQVAAIQIDGNFLFDAASHRDFLGSILGCGIERDVVGDIIVLGDRGAQAIVKQNVAQFLCDSLKQVRSVKVECRILEKWSDLKVSFVPVKKELSTVEASMRIDSVASAGFRLSRSKFKDLVESGQVKVNWKEISSPSLTLKKNDVVSVRGKGRITIDDVEVTAKERYRVKISRWV